ncbi:hypothetical protein GCM10007972_14800 [Iodidimonas muriae]|uniref:Cytochrome c domain-containing protein n=1 Tax=Iodidimonas muriae TaxID=261467 RepID=A0ABQ2LCT3_9PROT|nr:cytochrome c [Iodidimonas muriae]GER07271.1 hypothetical protein JCM17843_15810 [Kordiimonadales bacterium JCM 17843]GGO11206.1 hypothetical protein GCM10007972_14800 [Iodidimonas muriae]
MTTAKVLITLFLASVLAGLLPANAETVTGKAVYEQHCLSCHQADGGGVPMMQPELWGSRRINGPDTALIDFVLGGSASLPDEERAYSNEMPGFDHLSDAELAAVLSYIRSRFENDAPAIAARDIAARRSEM